MVYATGMWWIAACLGALVWLLVVRIKLKEGQRADLVAQRDAALRAKQRADFVKAVFLPEVRRYLAAHADVQSVMLLFARFEWPDRPSEVHVVVVPARIEHPTWPAALEHSLWVNKQANDWVFEPPQSHWDSFAAIGSFSQLGAFADLLPPVLESTPFEQAYRLYAVARRPSGTGAELEVVGEPTV